MLNEVPDNTDITRVANTILNEVPNSTDVICIVNDMHLTTMGAQQFSMVTKPQPIMLKIWPIMLLSSAQRSYLLGSTLCS